MELMLLLEVLKRGRFAKVSVVRRHLIVVLFRLRILSSSIFQRRSIANGLGSCLE
jgi:hypothetical protein